MQQYSQIGDAVDDILAYNSNISGYGTANTFNNQFIFSHSVLLVL
jgi:hypothetical protein